MRILLLAEFLVASQSAVILVLGEDSESPSCADVEILVAVSVTYRFGCWPCAKPPTWRTGRLLFVWPLTFDLSGMGYPTRTLRGPARTALRLLGAHKPPHHIKVVI